MFMANGEQQTHTLHTYHYLPEQERQKYGLVKSQRHDCPVPRHKAWFELIHHGKQGYDCWERNMIRAEELF